MRKIFKSINSDVDRQTGFDTFPYKSLLSFAPLIDFWKKKTTSRNKAEQLIALEVIKRLEDAIELMTPITNYQVLKKHQAFIELLMSGLFPVAQRHLQLGQAVRPFSLQGVYQTNGLKKFLQSNRLIIVNNRTAAQTRNNAIVRAGCMILNKFYGQSFPLRDPYIFSALSEDTSIETHYKGALNLDFLDIKKRRATPALSEKEIFDLINNFDQPKLWLEKLPPTHFEFHGFVAVQFIDVTEEESISRIRQFLLQKDLVFAEKTIDSVQDLLRSYFNISGLRLGFTVYDVQKKHQRINLNFINNHILKDKYTSFQLGQKQKSIYHRVLKSKQAQIFQNLQADTAKDKTIKSLVKRGVQSIYIAPLQRSNGKIFGFLELASPSPYGINSFIKFKIAEIQPLFRSALSRKVDEINNAVAAVIRDKFTNIHPSIEWKFLNRAYKALKYPERKEDHPLFFRNVFPLYGQSDIVSSTLHLNRAIQADNIEMLERLNILFAKLQQHSLDAQLTDYTRWLQQALERPMSQLHSEEEHSILNFLKSTIHPYLLDLSIKETLTAEPILSYLNKLDPEQKVINVRRKNFAKSQSKINQTIVKALAKEEVKLQKIIPHYFEKYQTDGIEYDMYLGQSILENGEFEKKTLQEFRAWQLRFMCLLTQKLERLSTQLFHKLQTAQLVLVHDAPLTIKFRMDEKKFDVEGEGSVRYAVLKKRIDKALIKGTANRLTLAQKVAIIYSQDEIVEEYKIYIQELINEELIEPAIEYLDVAPMQGIHGLKAIRITVRL